MTNLKPEDVKAGKFYIKTDHFDFWSNPIAPHHKIVMVLGMWGEFVRVIILRNDWEKGPSLFNLNPEEETGEIFSYFIKAFNDMFKELK